MTIYGRDKVTFLETSRFHGSAFDDPGNRGRLIIGIIIKPDLIGSSNYRLIADIDLFAVPYNRQSDLICRYSVEIGIGKHFPGVCNSAAVEFNYLISDLKPRFISRRVFLDLRYSCRIGAHYSDHDQRHGKSQNYIERRTADNDKHPLPDLRGLETAL